MLAPTPEYGHRVDDNRPDALGGGFNLVIADMGVSERHSRLRVPEHPGDGGQRYALRHGLTRYRVPQVMETNILDPGLPPRPAPGAKSAGQRL